MSKYSHEQKSTIWWKAKPIAGFDPKDVQQDSYGNWIRWSEYGNTSEMGWEIDHIYPESKGGLTNLTNLQPLHWQTNRQKSDNVT